MRTVQPVFHILFSYSHFAVNFITQKRKSPQHFKIQWEPDHWLYPALPLTKQPVRLIARRYHRRIKPRNNSQAQIRAEVLMEHGSFQRFKMLSEDFLLDTCAYYNLRGVVVVLRLRLWALSL